MSEASEASAPTIIAEQYYDSADADAFYFEIWGGEDIHIGLYESDDDAIAVASERTVEALAACIAPLPPTARILDLGAGYGGAARYLARRFECHVTCLNLSETQNERNRAINAQLGLDRIEVVHGNFEHLPFEDARFDVAWSQDSLLHSGARKEVLREAARVLVPGGHFVFTDPMQSPDAPAAVLGPILERIHLDDLASFDFYRQAARDVGLEVVEMRDMTEHLARHYARVRRELEARREDLRGRVDDDYIARMLEGLARWAEAGAAGHLAWGIVHLRKPG